MRKSFIVIAIALLLVGSFAICEEGVLIDFTKLSADITVNKANAKTDADGNILADENRHTVIDYGATAGATFTEDQKSLMKTSLYLGNWEVELNSSARNAVSLSNSVVKAAPVRTEKAGQNEDETVAVTVPFAGQEVMGVRIVFPETNVNSNAKVVPPFEIPAFDAMVDIDDDGNSTGKNTSGSTKTRFEDGYGVLKNVGTIKSISVTTMGMNFPHGLYVILKDTDGVTRRYFMGYLEFDGWKELVWNNPTYITDIRAREIRVFPIYPRGTPYVKFVGFQITRDAADVGGNFVGYFKDVKIIYDKALLTTERDIADEDLWGIVTDRESAKQDYEMTRFGNKEVDRYLEKAKSATETGFTSSILAEVVD
ncbi:MAG: flagellar filament outer layer protein FlaA [Treponema sp.]|nr:flagellar filament outer layer protein FlaA [Candidatus Treponema caballi]